MPDNLELQRTTTPLNSRIFRPHIRMKVLGLLAAVLAWSCSAQPSRPPSVPDQAVWAGGADGGAWVDCGMSTKEPLTTFQCSVFRKRGDIWIDGRSFALVDQVPGGYELLEGPFHRIHPISFDGDVIDVRGSRLLIPEEWVQRVGYDTQNWRVVRPNSDDVRIEAD